MLICKFYYMHRQTVRQLQVLLYVQTDSQTVRGMSGRTDRQTDVHTNFYI